MGVKGPPKDPKQDMTAALAAATAADSVVLVMGIDGTVEGEVRVHERSVLPRWMICVPRSLTVSWLHSGT